jgi:dolichyl-phosphooligosaccharide-protein glycotransferase
MFRRQTVKARGLLSKILPILELVLIFGIAMLIRVLLPYDFVFTSNGIAFTGNDAYYHMHLIQSLVNNFPHFPGVDPYLLFGQLYKVTPSFFQWLLATVAWIFGFGSPSPHLVDVLGVYYPAILGALTVVPVYFIGKVLWGRHGHWAGIVAAGLAAVLPGEFLGRSILGFTDQHVMETLLSTTAALFLIMALKSARIRELSFLDFRRLDWGKIIRPSIYAILCGLFLGLYIFAWQGALLLVFAVALFFIIQFNIDHIRNRSTEYLAVTGIIIFLVSLLFLPVAPSSLYLPSLIVGLLIPLGLGIVSYLMMKFRINRFFFPLAVLVGGAGAFGLFYLIDKSLVNSMLSAFDIFRPNETLLATVEAQSIFTPVSGGSGFFDTPAWLNFYITLPTALIGLLILGVQALTKRGSAEKTALIIWTLVMVVATIGQRRFAYYLAVNIALLAGFASILGYYIISWMIAKTGGEHSKVLGRSVIDLDGLSQKEAPAEAITTTTNKKARRRERQLARRQELARRRENVENTRNVTLVRDYFSITLSVVVIFMLLFSPLVVFADKAHNYDDPPTIATANAAPYAPSAAWMKAMAWMKDNTPEPLGSADAYAAHYTAGFEYPESAYSVMSWWDYGYWITYMGHRIPVANPGQDQTAVKKVANFLIAQDEASAEVIAEANKTGYVVIDYLTTTSKFWALTTWADKDQSEFFEVFWDPDANQSKLYIYPEYYQSMAARLYSFNGTAQSGVNTLVVEYAIRTTNEGSYKEVVNENQFATYEEAVAFMAGKSSDNFFIAGTDVLISPVPLAALEHYRIVYETEEKVSVSSSTQTSEIKIFKRVE